MDENEIKHYQLNTLRACAGISTNKNIVYDAAPIYKWTIGKHLGLVIKYYKNKKQFIRLTRLRYDLD